MKTINNPLSVKRVLGNKKKARETFLLVVVPFFTLGYTFCQTVHDQEVYDKINLTFNETKTVEYGSEFNSKELIKDVSTGKVIFNGSINTKILGVHNISYIISNEGVEKEFSTTIEVVDTTKPEINIDKDEITIYVGNGYDINSNIISVKDNVVGELTYKSTDITEDEKGYYTINTDFNKDKVGSYKVNIKAIDLNGNISEKSYTINVKEEFKYTFSYTNANVSASVDTTSVVTAAYSYIGYRYTPGGASPETGFDCSGFVYYIYGLFGKTVGRSTGDIVYSGTGVSRENMTAGDIIVWSTYSNNAPTHAALYVGNGMMIHAANSNDGVILSSVSDWESWGAHIVAIRRV